MHELNVENIISYYIPIVVTLGTVVVALVKFVKWVRLRRWPERRYTTWFLNNYGSQWNPYLEANEELDLAHVPLSVVEDRSDSSSLLPATAVIADPTLGNTDHTSGDTDHTLGNIVVVGDAGSGKTTTLKAYGVAALRRRLPVRGRSSPRQPDIPFFVPVHALTGVLHKDRCLVDHLESDILKAKAGLTAEEARTFLAQVLRQGRCVVLLDGIDEVGQDDYHRLCTAVRQFASDENGDLPTKRARLVVTCRRYNFLRIKKDWVGNDDPRPLDVRDPDSRRPFNGGVYRLAPLQAAEILQYLHKLRHRFTNPDDGPANFMAAIRAANTLDFHGTPLVLAMSVGLYAKRGVNQIPHSIADLYDKMIQEMLDRWRHSPDDSPGNLHFRREDKLRFLRELSLELAEGPTGFEPFDLKSMLHVAEQLRPSLQQVPEGRVDAFVTEIIDSSGLLSAAPERREYEFAHRSIQEHLAAAELALREDGASRLLQLVREDPEWRQVVLFFTARVTQRVVSPFLAKLADKDVVLAGACLASADCVDDVAIDILTRLARQLHAPDREPVLLAFAALIGATTSPRQEVQDEARRLVSEYGSGIVRGQDAVNAFGGDVHGLLDVVTLLVDRVEQAGQVRQAGLDGRLMSELTAMVPGNERRLVKPLWQFLTSPTIQPLITAGQPVEPYVKTLVERLLTLATDRDCFAQLQNQPAPDQSPVIEALREGVYPFQNGLKRSDNLVTLLCWAERIGLDAAHVNEFMKARASDQAAWARIETDRRWDNLAIPLPPLPHLVRAEDRSPYAAHFGLVLLLSTIFLVAPVVVDAASAEPVLPPPVRLGFFLLALTELGIAVALLFRVGVQLNRARGAQVDKVIDADDEQRNPHGSRRGIRLWRANPFVDLIYKDNRSRHWMGELDTRLTS